MVLFDFISFQSEQFLIPFLFVLAIVFGSLNLVKIFKSKPVNFLISLSLAFFSASNSAFIQLLWSQFGNIAIFFIAMFFIIFTLEAFGVRKGRKEGSDALIINGAILFVLLSISSLFVNSLPAIPGVGGGQNLLLLVFVVLIIVIFWSVHNLGPEGH
jgi:hypothetical protein